MPSTDNSIIDELDKKILNVLLTNSRLSYREIAKKIGVSVATVMNRVNRLQKEKLIKKYSAVLDYEKLGYDIKVAIDLRVSKGKLFEVEKKIASHPNVSAVYDVTGNFDCLLIATFKNRRMMDKFLKEIQTYDFVERTETRLVLNVLKEENIGLSS